jgi:hypothetical protein
MIEWLEIELWYSVNNYLMINKYLMINNVLVYDVYFIEGKIYSHYIFI